VLFRAAKKRALRRESGTIPSSPNPHWLSYAVLAGPTIPPSFSTFRTQWTVPSIPDDDGLTIFLFAGLMDESAQHILQPVLQWFPKARGAPRGSWGLQSWYVGPNRNDEQVSARIVPVSPGDQITSEIRVEGDKAVALFLNFEEETGCRISGLPPAATGHPRP
jgi:hypothetical protein